MIILWDPWDYVSENKSMQWMIVLQTSNIIMILNQLFIINSIDHRKGIFSFFTIVFFLIFGGVQMQINQIEPIVD
jgi:hypothetical protein